MLITPYNNVIPFPCRGGVYVLLNEADKRFYVAIATNIGTAICNFIKSANEGTFVVPQVADDYKLGKIQVVIIETCDDRSHCNVIAESTQRTFVLKGFRSYRKSRCRVGYRVVIEIASKGGSYAKEAYVVLRSKRGGKRVIGIFDTVIEAKDFVLYAYGTTESKNEVLTQVVALNSRTKEYYVRMNDSKLQY